jgi:hypothetical protein
MFSSSRKRGGADQNLADENEQSERIRLGIARLGPQGLRTQTRDSDDSSDEY